MAFQGNGNNAGVTQFEDEESGGAISPADQAAIDRGDILEGDELALGDDESGDATPPHEEFGMEALESLLDEEEGNVRIPKGRFNEVNERMKAAEAELAILKSQTNIQQQDQSTQDRERELNPPSFDFDAKEAERDEALLDGDTALAKSLSAEIRQAMLVEAGKIAQAEVAKIKTDEIANTNHRAAQEAANKAVADYPFLNDDPEAYDEVVALRDTYTRTGLSLPEAITKAADRVAIIYGIAPVEGVAPAQVASRTEAARSRNADAANRQPPPTLKMGSGNRAQADKTLNTLVMSSDEIAALPQAERKRLRGDTL